jgi:hypothetical protein
MHPRFFERWQLVQRDSDHRPRSDELSGLTDRQLIEDMLDVEAQLAAELPSTGSRRHLRLVDERLTPLQERHEELLDEMSRRHDGTHDDTHDHA